MGSDEVNSKTDPWSLHFKHLQNHKHLWKPHFCSFSLGWFSPKNFQTKGLKRKINTTTTWAGALSFSSRWRLAGHHGGCQGAAPFAWPTKDGLSLGNWREKWNASSHRIVFCWVLLSRIHFICVVNYRRSLSNVSYHVVQPSGPCPVSSDAL